MASLNPANALRVLGHTLNGAAKQAAAPMARDAKRTTTEAADEFMRIVSQPRVMALDMGRRYIGVAISDPASTSKGGDRAVPLMVIDRLRPGVAPRELPAIFRDVAPTQAHRSFKPEDFKSTEELAAEIAQLRKTHNVVSTVVGMPNTRLYDDKAFPAWVLETTRKLRAAGAFGSSEISQLYWSEHLTTQEAKRFLREEAGIEGYAKQKRAGLDKEAAAILLSDFLSAVSLEATLGQPAPVRPIRAEPAQQQVQQAAEAADTDADELAEVTEDDEADAAAAMAVRARSADLYAPATVSEADVRSYMRLPALVNSGATPLAADGAQPGAALDLPRSSRRDLGFPIGASFSDAAFQKAIVSGQIDVPLAVLDPAGEMSGDQIDRLVAEHAARNLFFIGRDGQTFAIDTAMPVLEAAGARLADWAYYVQHMREHHPEKWVRMVQADRKQATEKAMLEALAKRRAAIAAETERISAPPALANLTFRDTQDAAARAGAAIIDAVASVNSRARETSRNATSHRRRPLDTVLVASLPNAAAIRGSVAAKQTLAIGDGRRPAAANYDDVVPGLAPVTAALAAMPQGPGRAGGFPSVLGGRGRPIGMGLRANRKWIEAEEAAAALRAHAAMQRVNDILFPALVEAEAEAEAVENDDEGVVSGAESSAEPAR